MVVVIRRIHFPTFTASLNWYKQTRTVPTKQGNRVFVGVIFLSESGSKFERFTSNCHKTNTTNLRIMRYPVAVVILVLLWFHQYKRIHQEDTSGS